MTECTNQADENCNITTLVTIRKPGTFRNLAYLMLETYSKSSQISKMVKQIEDPGIVRTVYSCICKYMQGHPTLLIHVEAYWGRLRQIQALLRHIELYSDILRTLCNLCICSHALFRILAHLEPRAPSKTCWTYKMIKHI